MLYPSAVRAALAEARGVGSDVPPSVTTKATGLAARNPEFVLLMPLTVVRAAPTLVADPLI